MPFTVKHKQYLEAMGLVPWVRRDNPVANANTESVKHLVAVTQTSVTDVDRGSVTESLFRGHKALVHGEPSANLLLVFEAASGQTDLALNSSDNRLLLDMLKAIELNELCVARCLANAPIAHTCLETGCRAAIQPISAVLLMVTESPDIATDEQSDSRVVSKQSAVPVWRMPHPSWIQQQPELKRRAWNVLKAVRATLNESAVEQ